jgi:hypothetical protein
VEPDGTGSSLVVFYDYLKRTGDSPAGTDKLTESTPAAFVHVDSPDSIIYKHQSATGTYTDA